MSKRFRISFKSKTKVWSCTIQNSFSILYFDWDTFRRYLESKWLM